jgi:hypothetical protein
MVNEHSNKTELLAAVALPVSAISNLTTMLDETKFNTVPYEGSWTAGQLMDHVTKSIGGMAQAIQQHGKPTERNAGERIADLEKTFLDMDLKMQSPEFIMPGPGPFKKADAISALEHSLNSLNENAAGVDLNELLEGLPLGPITKLELLHFIVYHTTRHSYQMKKIYDALN